MRGTTGLAMISSLPAFFNASSTSSSEAPRLMLMFSCEGSTCIMFARRLRTPVTFFGPVIKTKLLSTTSTTTHLMPDSRPDIFTHNLPTSTAGTHYTPKQHQHTSPQHIYNFHSSPQEPQNHIVQHTRRKNQILHRNPLIHHMNHT